ncbi:hypothetical protein MMC25_002229 [Agyrium rufum]|nr:hypothetical protein [Agyrium rufum]
MARLEYYDLGLFLAKRIDHPVVEHTHNGKRVQCEIFVRFEQFHTEPPYNEHMICIPVVSSGIDLSAVQYARESVDSSFICLEHGCWKSHPDPNPRDKFASPENWKRHGRTKHHHDLPQLCPVDGCFFYHFRGEYLVQHIKDKHPLVDPKFRRWKVQRTRIQHFGCGMCHSVTDVWITHMKHVANHAGPVLSYVEWDIVTYVRSLLRHKRFDGVWRAIRANQGNNYVWEDILKWRLEDIISWISDLEFVSNPTFVKKAQVQHAFNLLIWKIFTTSCPPVWNPNLQPSNSFLNSVAGPIVYTTFNPAYQLPEDVFVNGNWPASSNQDVHLPYLPSSSMTTAVQQYVGVHSPQPAIRPPTEPTHEDFINARLDFSPMLPRTASDHHIMAPPNRQYGNVAEAMEVYQPSLNSGFNRLTLNEYRRQSERPGSEVLIREETDELSSEDGHHELDSDTPVIATQHDHPNTLYHWCF